MAITINLPDHLAEELRITCYMRLLHHAGEHDRALKRKDGNQQALLRIIQQQRTDAHDLYNEVSQAIRDQSPATHVEFI